MCISTAVINAFYQLKTAVPSRPHPTMHSSCSTHPHKHSAVTKQAHGWSWGTDAPCWGSSGKEIKGPQGAIWAALLKRAEDMLKCVPVCLCEHVLVLGLRGRGYKSTSRVYEVSSVDMSCLSQFKDKSRPNTFQQCTAHFQAFSCTRQWPQSIHRSTSSFYWGSSLY